jgi:hypothetical protein
MIRLGCPITTHLTSVFFTKIERFDRILKKVRRGHEADRVQCTSIGSHNFLNDTHSRLVLRIRSNTMCVQPLELNRKNNDALQEREVESNSKINPVPLLRMQPALLELGTIIILSKEMLSRIVETFIEFK